MRIRNLVVGILLAVGLLWAGYVQYQDPRIQELLGRRRPAPNLPVAEPARSSRPVSSPSPVREKPIRTESPSSPQPVRVVPSSPESAAANRQLASTILGILAARRLASGISLTVTDELVAVIGEVDEEQKKEGILDVLEKARGARRLDSSALTVSPAAGNP